MSMRKPLKNTTVRLSMTVQEAINLEALLILGMKSIEGGRERHQDLFKKFDDMCKKLGDIIEKTLDKAIAEEENGNV